MTEKNLRKALLNFLHMLFPELRDGTHLAHRARVLALHGEAGDVVQAGPRRYSVDVQPLTPDGQDDPVRAPIHDVPLELIWTGPQGRGLYALPAVGSMVLVAYIGGNASYPYVDRVLPDGHETSAVEDGELLIRHRNGTQVRLSREGHLEIMLTETGDGGSNLSVTQAAPVPGTAAANHVHGQTDADAGANSSHSQTAAKGGANRTLSLTDGQNGANLSVTLNAPAGGNLNLTLSGAATITAKNDVTLISETGQIRLAGGGPPLARVGDAVQVDATTHVGTITSGSAKVQAG